ncbi:MAG: hypothetical protein ACTSSG_07285 [Candidatus Heimdallarchaeaceae archaeon]
MSQQLTQLSKEQMQFKLKVKYETKPTTLLPTAQLVSNDLRVKVKDIGILFETHKKAWLVEQIELNENKLLSTILQQTTSGAWVAFEVVHDKDVEINKTFVEISRASKDLKIMMYPAYFLICILAFIEILLIKKTLFEKEVIILTKHDWQNILWITIAVIGWFALLFYYVQKQKLHEAYFQSVGLEYVSERTLDFYFLRKNRTLRYTIVLQCYRGYYYHPDLPKHELFRENRVDKETLENIKHQLKLANDAIRVIQQKELELHEEIETLQNEQRELQMMFLLQTEQDEVINDKLKENKQILETKKQALDELKKRIIIEQKEYEEKKVKLQKEFFDIIKDVYSLDEKKVSEQKLQEIIYAHQLSEKLRAKIADLRNINITTHETLAGLYDTMAQMQESFNQRVAEESARRTNTHYEYAIIAENDEIVPRTETKTPKRSGDLGEKLLNVLLQMLIYAAIIGGLIWGIITIIKQIATLNPIVATLIIVSMAIVLIVAYKMTNRFIKFATDTDQTIMYR